MIDTADVYSAWVPGHKGGESETVIGRWLKRDPAKRDKVVIATKVGYLDGEIVDGEYVAALNPRSSRAACDASLQRLGIDTHRPLLPAPGQSRACRSPTASAHSRAARATARSARSACRNFTAERIDEAVATARR